MSTAQTQTASGAEAPGEALNYLNHESGIWSWLTTVDHKRIGIMYAWAVAFFFLVGGLLALAVRMELFGPGETIMGADAYNQTFTLHASS